MPKTPDRFPGEEGVEGLNFDVADTAPDAEGEIRYHDGYFKGYDSEGIINFRGGGGITEAQHRILRQLIHFIDEGPAEGFSSGAYKEVLPSGGPFPTSIIWWESSSKLKKLIEKTITRSGGGATIVTPTPIVWKIYDTDGSTVLAEVSDAVVYSAVFETSRTRTITVY